MKRVRRFDFGEVTGAERTPQGYLRAPVNATRIGVFNYRMPDGSILRELRLPEEVFKDDSLRTLAGVPVTDDHPPVELLTPANTRMYQRGHTGDAITHDDNYVQAIATITDGELLQKVLDEQKREVSCGYTCQLEMTPGNWNGDEYDCVQRNIVYNHLAVVDRGRAGPAVRLKLDSADSQDVGIQVRVDAEQSTTKERKPMKKVQLGEQEYECEDALADAIQGMKDSYESKMKKQMDAAAESQKKMDAALAERDQAQAKADSISSELTKVKTDSAEKPDFKAALKERRAIEKVAEVKLDAETAAKIDEMENVDLMKAVIKAESPEANLDGKSEVYVQARFDSIRESMDASEKATRDLGAKLAGADLGNPVVKIDSEAARKKQIEDSQNAYKQPLTFSKNK